MVASRDFLPVTSLCGFVILELEIGLLHETNMGLQFIYNAILETINTVGK